MEFIDIHSHILPGVDDGAKDMDETLLMLQMAYQEGIRVMVATPHYEAGKNNISIDRLNQLLQEVKQAVKEAGIELKILLGNEILYSISALEALKEGKVLSMDGTRYILVEFLPGTSFKQIREGLYSCILAGYIPILAHAERYECLNKKPMLVGELRKLGVYIQINLSSIRGKFTNRKVMFCNKILKMKWVHFLGTDAHGAHERVPRMKEGVELLMKKYGEDTVRQLLWNNPMTMLDNKHL